MTKFPRIASVMTLVGMAVGLGYAADQTILGKQVLVKDPKPGVDATKRKVVGQGKEKGSPNTIVGNPTVSGAVLTVFADSASQSFVLAQGIDPESGKPYWSATSTGYKYKDKAPGQSAVKVAQIKKSNSGTFQIKAVALGKVGPVSLLPPNPGTSGCVRLDIVGGDSYHSLLGAGATIKKNDVKSFLIKNAISEGLCPGASTTTTTSTSTTTTTMYGSPSRAFLSGVQDLLD